MSNSDNPRIGALFQRQVMEWFREQYNTEFILEKKIPIGNPAKDHKFDIVDVAGTKANECKRYTWTTSGNVPSAKMGFTNEAAFYLSFLPDTYEKYIVLLNSHHPKRKESFPNRAQPFPNWQCDEGCRSRLIKDIQHTT